MKKRLFIAILLPESIQERLQALCSGLPGARWVGPEQMHLTLRFIGEVDGDCFLDICSALEKISATPLSLQLDGLGFFPPRKQPRVLWVGVSPNEDLLRLHHQVNALLNSIGLEPEQRKFAPHITLARLKNTPTSRLSRYLEYFGLFQTHPFTVEGLHLYSSILSSKGACHSIEQWYPFF